MERPSVYAIALTAIAIGLVACGDDSAETETASVLNQPPVISGTITPTAIEDQFYSFKPRASDPDGDPITFAIVGKPGWMDFNTATGELSGTPRGNNVGKHRGIVISVSDGAGEAQLPASDIEVLPADASSNQPPSISGTPPDAVTAGNFYDFIPTVFDADGDPLSFSIVNGPSWASFDAQIGRLSGTPSTSVVGTYGNIEIHVSDGIATAALGPFVIVVNPPPSQNAAPVISGQPASSVFVDSAYVFTPTASDPDGDPLSFTVFNAPVWATFDPSTGSLTGTPGRTHAGNYTGISIVVSDGQASTALAAFSISVVDPNRPPVISGTPGSSATVGTAYSFTPTASDPDGDSLTFSIANRPSWAAFNTATGRLSGTPGSGNVSSYTGISITVSDGKASASLAPFSITVAAANSAPTISGNPGSSVLVGSGYAFVPVADDPDGDVLSFAISGRPSWATFDASDGSLSGMPSAGDVGTYASISITVTDGQASDVLGPFSIAVVPIATGSATLSWAPPTENTDGTALVDLAGYIIYWGTASGSYTNSVTLQTPGITTYVVDNLLSGSTYYFATKAFNTQGLQSSFSNEASKLIP